MPFFLVFLGALCVLVVQFLLPCLPIHHSNRHAVPADEALQGEVFGQAELVIHRGGVAVYYEYHLVTE